MKFAASMKSSQVSRNSGADPLTGEGVTLEPKSLRGDETHQAETGNQESGRTQMKLVVGKRR